MADSMKMVDHVDLIDQTATHWLTSNQTDTNMHRLRLALYSYDLTNIFENASIDQVKLQNYKSEYYQLQVLLFPKLI